MGFHSVSKVIIPFQPTQLKSRAGNEYHHKLPTMKGFTDPKKFSMTKTAFTHLNDGKAYQDFADKQT